MSTARPGFDSVTNRASTEAVDDEPSRDVAPRVSSRTDALNTLLDAVARTLDVPIALLSRDSRGWRFEAEAFPRRPVDPPPFRSAKATWNQGTPASVVDASGSPWTGLLVGQLRQRDWLLMVPGTAERWQGVSGLDDLISRFAQGLEAVVQPDDERELAELHRRLYAFIRRLTRTSESGATHTYILQTLAREVSAETGAFAVFGESEQALSITATHGYPLAIVEHVRISPGEGVIGRAFATGRAALGRPADDRPRRFRYKTDSFIALPLVAAGKPLAVVTLTDRADGMPFEGRDLAAARLLAAPAALALARQRVSDDLDELTRAATVDAVTGLFNRRYFETMLEAEVQRARRQQQGLALLMVDIDDFKRINDTFGHLEGDRALRDVADLLRRGVRIFDICARYGGEEFAIVMPGATRQMAVQVAERIRRGMQDRSRLTPLAMTVSIGVGFLGPEGSQEDLVGAADRALIAAKRAGKNVVKTD